MHAERCAPCGCDRLCCDRVHPGTDVSGRGAVDMRFGPSVLVRLPGNDASAPNAFFMAVDCAQPALRRWRRLGGQGKAAREPMIGRSINGSWRRATPLRMPSSFSVWIARARSIDCTGPGTCVEVGDYWAPHHGGRFHRAPCPRKHGSFAVPDPVLCARLRYAELNIYTRSRDHTAEARPAFYM